MQVMQTLMITSVTRHQQRFSMRNTKINGRNNAVPIMQGMIGAAWRLPGRNPETGVVSYPVPGKRERNLHTCAQDVQITRMATI
jgi:hypothetical protein